MSDFLANLLDPSNLTPHGFCLAWQPTLLWLDAAANLAIAVAYYSIPVALLILTRRRRDLAYRWVFRLFAAFIIACGTTHVMDVLTLWVPAYAADALVSIVTAGLSLATAVLLWPLLPRALALPSPEKLGQLNVQLQREVADRDAAVLRLRESEARSRSTYRRSPAALYVVDMDRRLSDVSDTLLELLGYARAEVIGRPIYDFLQRDAETPEEDWERLMATGQLRELPRVFRCRDGQVRDTLVSARLERDAAGRPAGVVTAVIDVTERKRAEAALRASEERLRQSQKMEAVGQLTGGIAHDFNNMLTVIMSSLELIQQRLAQDPRLARLVESALTGADRAARLTSQLLSFSRRQRLAPEALDPSAVVASMSELLARTLGEQISLELDTSEAPAWACFADANQLATSLLNLVLNATAAISGAGAVTIGIAARSVTAAEAEAEAEGNADGPIAPGDYVSIAVSDSGTGMTETVRRQAIEPFFTTKAPGRGTGLGLSQVYGFARQSGGTLRIESAIGRGTRVEILLPRAAGGAAPVEAAERPGLQTGRGDLVLIVEDEPDLRQMVVQALEELNYRVMSAGNADTALDLLRTEPEVALLFSDVAVPGAMNGVQLALEARRLRPRLPVLFATGYSDRVVLDQWGDDLDLLAKPYSLASLCGRIAERLGRPVAAHAA